ncbi:MAG: FHA domain-containing protein [Anaerolineae bacterium]|nr:FHA domain-containing protein [Anaerolineae bacterium]
MAAADGRKDLPVVVMTQGALRGHQWVMYSDELVIGRGATCDIVLPERAVSREHARIWREGRRFLVQDLDSKNGTFVNGQPASDPVELHEGDELQIALAVTLRFISQEATMPLEMGSLPDVTPRGITLDERTRQVTVNDRVLDPPLSLHQYRLLELLFERDGAICTREEIVHAVWPDAVEEGVSEQAIDALVRRLRDRLAEVDADRQYIVTMRGHGFKLE